MNISQVGIDLLHHFESCRLKAYPDPKTGGAPYTIGWGRAYGVSLGDVWTQEQADYEFLRDLMRVEKDVRSLVKVPLTQGQFDALVSFAYNCGSDIDSDDKAEGLGDSTLLKKLNKGDYKGAEAEFHKWISKGTPAEKGLRRRRKAEAELFARGSWSR